MLELPAGGLALFTDGGSNKNRTQTGWGVLVVQKQLTGSPKVIAEFFGPVSTSPFDEYFIGATGETNNTAELTAVCQALYFLINDGGHWPAVIVSDSEIALSAMDGMRALFELATQA